MTSRKGFTLVEIMIVVAIIALLAAIAIPNLLNARRTANQTAARANIHTMVTMAETFAAGGGAGSYPTAITADMGASAANYCADLAGAGTTRQGYVYACTSAATGYLFTATPVGAQQGTLTYSGATGGIITPGG